MRYCSLFFKDFFLYLKNYCKDDGLVKKILLFLFSARSRLISYFLYFLLKRVDKIICISKKQEKIFNNNGFKNTIVIYNLFTKLRTSQIIPKVDYLFYGGRLTPGKGVELFLKSVIPILKKRGKLKLLIGGDGFLKSSLIKIIKKNNLDKQVKLLGQLPYGRFLNYLRGAKITVVPSIWEEPFGRVALESIFSGVPVVASNKGGLPEIVEDQTTGYLVPPIKDKLRKAISLSLKNNQKLRKNIKIREPTLKRKFQINPVKEHINLYKSL
jgi:glycosyltransferase involved in cell wall biosynthesis